MFERYTEKARRVIFFARYEASQFGSPYIETEHLLMGILREDKTLTNRFLRSYATVQSIRSNIEAHSTTREKIATSVDLPLSNESKRVLAYAAEEAERLANKNIGPEHLLLGLLREEKCFAAHLLNERGVELEKTRKDIKEYPPPTTTQREHATPVAGTELFRDLTRLAADGKVEPVAKRDAEIGALIEILCCRQRNCALLVGEQGVGKTAIIEGLAQRVANGAVPLALHETRLMAIDPAQVTSWVKGKVDLLQVAVSGMADGEPSKAVLVLDDLSDAIAAAARAGAANVTEMLRYTMTHADIRCVASCTPTEFRELKEKTPGLVECFRLVQVRALDEETALDVVRARKANLEKFHEVTYAEDALEAAVRGAAKHLPATPLPGKALELLDAAGARVKVRQGTLPEEVTEIQKRIRFIVHRMDSAIQNHEFEKARFYSDEEKKERERLRAVRERLHLNDAEAGSVGAKEIEEVLARWGGYPYTA